MKKIPTLFRREYDGPHRAWALDEVKSGLEWVLAGEGIATVKVDGTCCAVMGGEFYCRYDAKAGRRAAVQDQTLGLRIQVAARPADRGGK